MKEVLNRPDLLIIAGEHSGDEHATRLVKNLKHAHPKLYICAMGGRHLESSGADLIFDLVSHSVVGIFEVLKNYFFFKKLLNETVSWIEKHKPRAVLFVDYPGFNLYLAQKLFDKKITKKRGGDVSLLYYISPQIWAWKPKRRFKMEKLLDSLAVIFPFEKECFSDTELPVTFVGHPFVQKEMKMPVAYDANGPILLLPGSRKMAVSRIFPIILKAFVAFSQKHPEERALVIYPSDKIKQIIESYLKLIEPRIRANITIASNEKKVSGKAVLMSSGTMSLICALAGIPGAIVYKANWFTYILGRLIVKIPYLGIANLLMKKEVYPEYIQERATIENLIEIIENSNKPDAGKIFQEKAEAVKASLKAPASCCVEEWLLNHLNHK